MASFSRLALPSLLSPHFWFRNISSRSFPSLALVGGAGIVVLIDLTHDQAPFLHFAGLLLVFMTIYTAFKLRFLYATAVGWTMIGMYEVSAVWLNPPALTVFLTDNFFYISANLMGMFTNYQRELYGRQEFLQARRMQEIEQQKHALEKDRLNEAVDRAVRSLRESESRFRTLAETTAAAIIIHRGGRFLYVNPTVQRLTGYCETNFPAWSSGRSSTPTIVSWCGNAARRGFPAGRFPGSMNSKS